MTGAPIALGIVVLVVLGTIGFALRSVRTLRVDPEEYIVGGRSFGTIFLWVLLAGEIYTSFTFLGAAGWAYGYGAPAFYILAYGTCGYVIGYFMLPAIWEVGKRRGLLTGADFFTDRYGSPLLGGAVAIVQFVLVVPYVTLQLSGLQILLQIAGYGAYGAKVAVCIAFLLIAFFVFTAGLRGTAWASIVKDALVLGAVVFAGIAIPTHFFGSPSAMLDQVLRVHPNAFSLLPGSAPRGTVWFVSTVLLSAIGFYMGPQSFNAVFSARSGNTLRRNAMLLPFYQIVMLLVFFAGFSALLVVPGLKGQAVDQSFLLVVQRFYPAWVMGFVAAAGALASLIPASALLLAAASVASTNVLGPLGLGKAGPAHTLATRILVVVVAILALVLWLEAQQTLVELLLIFYNGITQLAPGTMAALLWRRANAWSVGAGLAVGLILVVLFTATGATLGGLNAGFVALAANVLVMLAVSFLTPPRPLEGTNT